MATRTFVIELLAGASGGKSTQIKNLQKRFLVEGVHAATLSATHPTYMHLRTFLHDEERGHRDLQRFPDFAIIDAKKRSLVFQAILLSVMETAESSIAPVVLVEQGPFYGFVVESFGLQVPNYVLEYFLGDLKEPDKVIFLDVPVDVLRKREATRMLWDKERMEKICQGITIAYESNRSNPHWLRVDGTKTPDEIFEDIWPEVWCAFQKHQKKPAPPRGITF